MNVLKSWAIMIFAIGIGIVVKYMDFKPWVEENAWIGFPMIAFGCLGICFLFDGRN